jgi:hypothetical protein
MKDQMKEEYRQRQKDKYKGEDEYDEDDAWGDVRKAKQVIEKYNEDMGGSPQKEDPNWNFN